MVVVLIVFNVVSSLQRFNLEMISEEEQEGKATKEPEDEQEGKARFNLEIVSEEPEKEEQESEVEGDGENGLGGAGGE